MGKQGRPQRVLAPRNFCAALAMVVASTVAPGCRGAARTAPPLPTDPLAWVPPPSRALLAVDLAALRRAPALARWIRARAGGGCAAALSERVRRLAVVSPRGDLGDFALVLAGDLSAREVAACARATAPGATVRTLRYRGAEVLRIAVGATDGGRPSDAEVDLLPNGVAIVGPALLARAALDAGLSLAQGEAEPHALAALWDPIPRDAALRLAARLDAPSLPFAAVGAWARVGDRVSLTARAVAADEERAVDLAHRAIAWRDETAAALTSPALRDLLGAMRVRAAGRAVEAEASLDADRLEVLWVALRALAEGPSPSPPTAPPRP